jgi:hypothetical protein
MKGRYRKRSAQDRVDPSTICGRLMSAVFKPPRESQPNRIVVGIVRAHYGCFFCTAVTLRWIQGYGNRSPSAWRDSPIKLGRAASANHHFPDFQNFASHVQDEKIVVIDDSFRLDKAQIMRRIWDVRDRTRSRIPGPVSTLLTHLRGQWIPADQQTEGA